MTTTTSDFAAEGVPIATAVRLTPKANKRPDRRRDLDEEDVVVSLEVEEEDEDDSSHAAITYQQLMDLEEEARQVLGRRPFERATMRTVISAIIEPSCRQTGVCYARQLNPEGLRTDAFITHAWDEPFGDFVEVRTMIRILAVTYLDGCFIQF